MVRREPVEVAPTGIAGSQVTRSCMTYSSSGVVEGVCAAAHRPAVNMTEISADLSDMIGAILT